MKSICRAIGLIAAFALGHAGAGEILLHSGPTVSTPDLKLYSSLSPSGEGDQDLQFIYEFFLDEATLAKASREFDDSKTTLEAVKAIELASGSVEGGDPKKPFPVRKLELLVFEPGRRGVSYYLVSLLTNGTAETHRIVLMNGTVVKPKLRRLGK